MGKMQQALAPYSVHRFFDGAEVIWIITKEGDPRCAVDKFETREEAEAERNRLNSKHALDTLGIF